MEGSTYVVVPIKDKEMLEKCDTSNLEVFGLLKFQDTAEFNAKFDMIAHEFNDVLLIAVIVKHKDSGDVILKKQDAQILETLICANISKLSCINCNDDSEAARRFFEDDIDFENYLPPQLFIQDDPYSDHWVLHFQDHKDKQFQTASELLDYIHHDISYAEIPTFAEHIVNYSILRFPD